MKKIFKRVMCVGVVVVMISMLFAGCESEQQREKYEDRTHNPFVKIEGKVAEKLVYHEESKTVYVMYEIGNPYSYGFLSEYIVNGHNCEYHDGKFFEVIPRYEIVDNKLVEIGPEFKELTSIKE